MDKEHTAAAPDDWRIPLLVKAAASLFAFSGALIFVLSLLSEQKTLFGFSARLVSAGSFALVLLSVPLVIAFLFFPRSAPVLFLYWLLRFLREPLCVFAMLGVVYLIAARAGLFSVRGGIPALNLLLLFLMALSLPPAGLNDVPLPWMKKFSTLAEGFVRRINTVPRWIFRLAVALLPIAIVCAQIYLGLHASLRDYRPYSSWEDETAYWVRVRSFSQVGLNAGYNSPNELAAPAAFSRYGEGSPLYIYFYGSIARLIGWSPQLPLLINFVILALAIFLFTYLAKLEPLQILLIGLVAVLTWPVISYLTTTTHETLNQAIAFILAIVFSKLLSQRESVSLPLRLFFVFLIYLAALIRLSWGLLLVPVLFYCLNGKLWLRFTLAVVLGLGLYVSAMLITSYLVPPLNNSIFVTLQGGLVHGPQVFLAGMADQFSQMFRSGKLNASIAVMFQMAVIIVWSTVRLVRTIRGQGQTDRSVPPEAFDIYNVGTLAISGLIFYLQAGFARTFAPAVLLTYLLLAARKEYRFLGTLLALNLAFFPFYMGTDRIIRADFTKDFPGQASLQSNFERWMVFDPQAQNPWCNTLLIPLNYYDYRLTIVPPGIGVSFIAGDYWSIQTPLKSKYLLFDKDTYEQLSADLHVELLDSSSLGDLYYNLDSGCAPTP